MCLSLVNWVPWRQVLVNVAKYQDRDWEGDFSLGASIAKALSLVWRSIFTREICMQMREDDGSKVALVEMQRAKHGTLHNAGSGAG